VVIKRNYLSKREQKIQAWMLPTTPILTIIAAQNKSLGGTEKSVESRHDLWFAIFHIISQAVIFVTLSLIIVLQNTSCSVFLANSVREM
jgi:hypothetical protein